uniref:CUB domain-containing protein n=1 Tax=Panagrolaimus superbus TaxID=310955 RepID=A0A914YXX3_9BILA
MYLSIFWFIFVSIHCYDDIIECNENSQTIFIKNGSYTLLQSPNFPESVSYNSSWSCSITFDTNDTSLFIWFGMLAGNVDLIQLQGGENYLNNLTAT